MNELSRRQYLKLMAGGVIGLIAGEYLPVTNWNTLRGTTYDRIKAWNKLQSQLNEARQSGDLTAVSEIEKAQYMWVAANGLEQGARLEGMNLAAAHMNRFLYGPEGDVDLSKTLANYLQNSAGDTVSDQSLRLGETIIDAVQWPDISMPFKSFNVQQKKEILDASQNRSLAYAGVARVRKACYEDWFQAVGISSFQLNFIIEPASFFETSATVGGLPVLQVSVSDLNLSMNDKYDWVLPPYPFSASNYAIQFLYTLGISTDVRRSLNDYIEELEREHFPDGLTEKDFGLLVKYGVAGNFDMHAKINLHNVEILV